MRTHAPRLLASTVIAGLVAVVLIVGMPGLNASDPRGARYCSAPDSVFWFVQASDLHIGTSESGDTTNLSWLVNDARNVINPSFIVVTGDLTDSTNGNIFGYPNGPYQAEWDSYKGILSAAGITAADYYDLPGNHDAYNDRYFAYYLANSVQGRATGRTQHSWTRQFSFGKYHFLGVNSSDNTGAPFNIFWPYGDHAGLDATELSYIRQELIANAGANLTFVFGHHPVTDTGASQDTWLYYGHEQFITDLDYYRASSYGYGHTHETSDVQFTGNSDTGFTVNGGVRYPNIDALGKDGPFAYRVFAVDCDGVSSVSQPVGTWPLVMITAPVSKYLGSTTNPYAYTVPNASVNPIRALVFDAGTVTSVTYRVDGGTPVPMARVAGSPALWNGVWDASGAAPGEHTIEVRAEGSGTRSHVITVAVTGAAVNQPPQANPDSYSTASNTTLTVPSSSGVLSNDTDPERQSLTVDSHSAPAHGTLTLDPDGSFTYVPAANSSGEESFTYIAKDSGGAVSAPATVSLTVTAPPPPPPPPPTTDTVTVTAATWSKRTTLLSVTATSSLPNVTLTVRGYTEPMAWNKKKNVYTFSAPVSSAPAEVFVDSSGGGSGSRVVKITK